MSHHLDSPASRKDSRLNITDLYVFDGDTGTVLTMVTNTSLAGDARVPGFHPEARYEFRVHPDLSPTEPLTYRCTFGGADGSGRQSVTVHRLTGSQAIDDTAEGRAVAQGHTGEAVEGEGVRIWAGEAADPFYLDLRHLAHVLEGVQNREPIDNGDWVPQGASSSFTGSQVDVIVLEISNHDAPLSTGRQIGVWADTRLATDAGGWHQTNRAAIPMMWPIFRAMGGDDTSAEYQRDTVGHPVDDLATIGERVAEMVAAAVEATGVADTSAYGRVVAERLLPDLLSYRVGTPAAFTFAGFNGRSLSDNAPEVMYGLITNSAIPTGLSASVAAGTRQEKFPYVARSAGASARPTGG